MGPDSHRSNGMSVLDSMGTTRVSIETIEPRQETGAERKRESTLGDTEMAETQKWNVEASVAEASNAARASHTEEERV